MTTGATGTLDSAAEEMVRRGYAGNVHRWLDAYTRRLEEFPRGTAAIGEDWQEALGDPRRVAAAATHGVNRVGHAAGAAGGRRRRARTLGGGCAGSGSADR